MNGNLASHKITKSIVEKYGFTFTKSLGQNFLVDNNILQKIVAAGEIDENDIVFEIGTGIGTLTYELAKKSKKVIAIEIDSKLIPILSETLKEFDNVTIVNEDILKTDLNSLIKNLDVNQPIKVIANLPYYITTAIIMRFLESKIPLSKFVVMVQKEVADRMAARPSTKAYGSLSVAIQYYGNVEVIGKASRAAFIPPPAVDSAIVAIEIRKQKLIEISDSELFFKVVRGSFSKRRKTIYNSLSTYEDFQRDLVRLALKNAKIEENRRGESLDIKEFAKLSNEMYKLIS
ncbi:MAG: 16S rRNA (adenine(1518)-N(6)/adenine(1519)-N(6))-dimethyltransferase RsmA [Filifactoraceae bacterium]